MNVIKQENNLVYKQENLYFLQTRSISHTAQEIKFLEVNLMFIGPCIIAIVDE